MAVEIKYMAVEFDEQAKFLYRLVICKKLMLLSRLLETSIFEKSIKLGKVWTFQ